MAFSREDLENVWTDKQESHEAIVEILKTFLNKKKEGKNSWEVSVICLCLNLWFSRTTCNNWF